MKIKITTVGLPSESFLKDQVLLEGSEFTIKEALNALFTKYGNDLVKELMEKGKLNKDLSLLLNGRNVLSLPDKFQTSLRDKDEIIITTHITGG